MSQAKKNKGSQCRKIHISRVKGYFKLSVLTFIAFMYVTSLKWPSVKPRNMEHSGTCRNMKKLK